MAASMLTASSCSDFDDYNEAPAEQSPTAAQTLWENINSTPELSEFAALVKKSGYDKELSSSRFYTVWAPLNGHLDLAKWQNADSATLRFQFVENHIADYNHYISSPVDERIITLNEKSYNFKGSADDNASSFGGQTIAKSNVAALNGVIHQLSGEAVYRYNFYEYLTANKETDSLSNYVMRYEMQELDEQNSVAGPIVDGIQTYEDSVMIISNAFLDGIRCNLDNEDSTYTMLLPTNEAWEKSYATVKSNLNYGNGTILGERYYMDNTTQKVQDDLKDEVNASYLSDSLTRKAIASTLVFSNNNLYNTWLSEGTTGDTLMATNRYTFSNPAELLSQQTGAAIQMSNGTGILVDSLAFKPWETYKPCLVTMRMGAYKNATEPKNITISTFNEGVGMLDIPGYPDNIHWSYDLNFQWIKAKMSSDETAFYNLSGDIMSSSYSIYCIMVPPCADADYSSYDPDAEMKQTLFNASLRYYNPSTKKMAEHYFHPTKPEGSSTGPKTNADKMDEWAFKNDITKVDAVYLGDFTFPVTYVGLSNCYPNLKIIAPKLDTANKNLYSRDLRIAGILLIPTEITKSNAE